jgi:hypothetical protein
MSNAFLRMMAAMSIGFMMPVDITTTLIAEELPG